jgi:hypothetical protein
MDVVKPIPRSERDPSVWELCAPTSEQRATAKAAAQAVRPERDSVQGEMATLMGELHTATIQVVGEFGREGLGVFDPCCRRVFDDRSGLASRLRDFLLNEMENQAADAMLGLPQFY